MAAWLPSVRLATTENLTAERLRIPASHPRRSTAWPSAHAARLQSSSRSAPMRRRTGVDCGGRPASSHDAPRGHLEPESVVRQDVKATTPSNHRRPDAVLSGPPGRPPTVAGYTKLATTAAGEFTFLGFAAGAHVVWCHTIHLAITARRDPAGWEGARRQDHDHRGGPRPRHHAHITSTYISGSTDFRRSLFRETNRCRHLHGQWVSPGAAS